LRYWQKEHGFSLIETLVVVAIVGLMASAVVLSLPNQDGGAREKLLQTEAALVAVARQSIITGRVYGLRLTIEGFEVQTLSDDGWQAETTLLKPDVMRWGILDLAQVSVDGVALDLSVELARPHIWFLPSGDSPEIELRFVAGGEMATVKTATDGYEVRYVS